MSTYFRLDFVAGWREESRTGVMLTPIDGHLRLHPLAGRAQRTRLGGRPALACVRALATDDCGHLYLLDSGKNMVRRKTSANGQLECIPAIGDGKGEGSSAPRQLRQPRGIALDRNQRLWIADTGNDRVQVFHPDSWTLLHIVDSLQQPWGIAADRRRVFIVERGANRITLLNLAGDRTGEWTHPRLREPRQIAVDTQGRLAVIADGALLLFEPDSSARVLHDQQSFTALAFDPLGRLHAGTATGLLYQFVPDENGELLLAGNTFCGVEGRIDAISAWPPPRDQAVQLLLSVIRPGDRRSTFWKASAAEASAAEGVFVSEPLDSRVEQCVWHRMVFKGHVPEGGSIEVSTQTAEDPSSLTGDFPAQPSHKLVGPVVDPDCLVQSAPGRALRFRLAFRSNGVRSPEFRAIHIEFPRESYLRYLPSIYQDDAESRAFLERFLSIFQTAVDEENAAVSNLYQILDPHTVPEKLLRWLAQWLAFPLNPSWPVEYQRAQLANAWTYYKMRGTRDGLKYAVENFARVAFAEIVEHYQLRRIPDLCSRACAGDDSLPLWSPRIYSRWQVGRHSTVGELRLLDDPEPASEPFALDAHKFSVFFPVDDPLDAPAIARTVSRTVEQEKPAHTEAVLCAVYPRLRIGVQSRVGVDTRVGHVSFMMLSGEGERRMSTLGYDTVLNAGPEREGLQRRGIAVLPSAGESTRLL
jgi:phage tail-like protein